LSLLGLAQKKPATAGPDAKLPKPPDSVCKLPLFRPVALKLLKLLSSEDPEFSEIARWLECDPGFSAEVLALANSVLYGTVCQIDTLPRAILVLGLERTKALTITTAVRAFIRKQGTPQIQLSWNHSLACALVAEDLAPLYGMSRDRAYTAGLMHDIGRLALLAAYPRGDCTLVYTLHETIQEVRRLEQQMFEMDHCQVGSWLARAWGFPDEFGELAARHHDSHAGKDRSLVALVRIACRLADALGFSGIRYQDTATLEELVGELPGYPQNASWRVDDLQARIRDRFQLLESAAG